MSSNNSQDQNEIQQDDGMYEVQEIKGKRKVGKKIQYHVKWLNWDRPEDMTWEPIQNLASVLDMVKKFEQDLKQKRKSNDDKNMSKEKPQKSQIVKQKRREKQKQRIKKQILQQSNSQQSGKSKQVEISDQSQQQKNNTKKLKSFSKKPKQIEISESLEAQQEPQIESKKHISQKAQRQNRRNKKQMQQKQTQIVLTVGDINKIQVKYNGEIFYQVDVNNSKGQCVGVKLLTSQEIKSKHEQLLLNFLQNYMIDEERIRSMR